MSDEMDRIEIDDVPAQDPSPVEDPAPQASDSGEDDLDAVVLYTPNPRVTMTTSPFSHKPPKGDPQSLRLPTTTLEDIERLVNRYGIRLMDPEQELDAEGQRMRDLALMAVDAISTQHFATCKSRENSDWRQEVMYDGKPLRAAKAVLRQSDDPVLRVRQELGIGGLIQIPLWSSGIWLTLQCPSDGDLYALHDRLAREKQTLGRASNGIIFGASEIYMTDPVVNFVLDHVHSTTAPSRERDVLKSIIRVTDIPQMVMGLALTMFPDGYPLTQECLVDRSKCKAEIKQMLNLSKVSWTDNALINEKQRKHMAKRTKVQTMESIQAYQDEFSWGVASNIDLNSTLTLRLKIPSLQEQADRGYAWVESINAATSKAFSMGLQGNERESYISTQAMLQSLGQFAHWTEAVINTAGDSEEVIDDVDQMDRILGVIVSNEDLTRKVHKTLLAYMDAVTVTQIALVKEPCPSCNQVVADEYLLHPDLIPLDVMQVFFTLRFQKVTGVLTSQMRL